MLIVVGILAVLSGRRVLGDLVDENASDNKLIAALIAVTLPFCVFSRFVDDRRRELQRGNRHIREHEDVPALWQVL
jgi:hypothetical protein